MTYKYHYSEIFLTPLPTHSNNHHIGLTLPALPIKKKNQNNVSSRVMDVCVAQHKSQEASERDLLERRATFTPQSPRIAKYLHGHQDLTETTDNVFCCVNSDNNTNMENISSVQDDDDKDVFFWKCPSIASEYFHGNELVPSSPNEVSNLDTFSADTSQSQMLTIELPLDPEGVPSIPLQPRPRPIQLAIDI